MQIIRHLLHRTRLLPHKVLVSLTDHAVSDFHDFSHTFLAVQNAPLCCMLQKTQVILKDSTHTISSGAFPAVCQAERIPAAVQSH